MSQSKSKLVALFGTFTLAQLKALAENGWTALSSDHPSEADLYGLAKEAGLRIVRKNAAWGVLDHQLSQEATRINQRTGNPEQYNANGGYVRDAQIVEAAHAVIVGLGIVGRRLQIITDCATAAERPLRQLKETVEPDVVDYVAVAQELEALPLE